MSILSMVEDGGGRKKQDGMELLEHMYSAPRGYRPQHVEKQMSMPCVPTGTEKIQVKVRNEYSVFADAYLF